MAYGVQSAIASSAFSCGKGMEGTMTVCGFLYQWRAGGGGRLSMLQLRGT